jgi:protein-tyrosine phosphatase
MTPLFWIDRRFPGRLAVAARPRGDDWLEDEFAAWRCQNADVIVSLLAPEEYEELGLISEPRQAAAAGMEFIPCPVADRGVPASAATFLALAQRLGKVLLAGRNVAIHCRQGVGRSALLAVAVLVTLGVSRDEAWAQVRTARGVPVPDTAEQRAWLDRHAQIVSHPAQPA